MVATIRKIILFASIAIMLIYCSKPKSQFKALKDSSPQIYAVNIQNQHLDSIENVLPISDSLVVPVVYDSLLIGHFVSSDERKEQFINQVLPSVLIVKFNLQKKIKIVDLLTRIDTTIGLCPYQKSYLDSLTERFRATSSKDLLERLKPHPTSLVLAQAIVESGWGTSRFAIEGNNLFGIWTTANDPNVIKSIFDRDDQKIYVKKYSNISESIAHYFLTLGRHSAYQNFRNLRSKNVNVDDLIKSLNLYSEMGEDYTALLEKIIEWNDLKKYDSYQIDPKYIVPDNEISKHLLKPCNKNKGSTRAKQLTK